MDAKSTATPGAAAIPEPRPGPLMSAVHRVGRNIRDRILGGLILILPILITFWVIRWLYLILEEKIIDPLAAVVLWKLNWTTSGAELPYWFEKYVAPVIAIILALILLYVLDLFADTRLSRGFGWVLTRLPVISQIYNPVRKMLQALEKQPGKPSMQRLVLVKFPHPGIKLPAFVTASCRDVETQKVLLCVYVPTTPVPTSGFFLIVPEEEVTELNWSSEQTLEAIMSGGLTAPPEISYFTARAAANLVTGAAAPREHDAPQPHSA